MDERWANIDLLFRNGLKDYEALPPQGVWDNIHPVIKKKHNYTGIYRTAAIAAVLTGIVFISYFMIRGVRETIENNFAALDLTAISPVKVNDQPPDKMLIFIPEDVIPVDDIKQETLQQVGSDQGKGPSVISNLPGVNLSGNRTFINQLISSVYKENNKEVHEFSKLPEPEGYTFDEYKSSISNRWSMSAMASPTYYSNISTGANSNTRQLMSSEKAASSFSGGLSVLYKINKRLTIQTGFYYAKNGQQVDGVYSFAGFKEYVDSKGSNNFEVMTSSGPVYAKNPDVFLSGSSERISTAYTNDVFDPEKARLNYMDNALIQNFSYIELPVMLRYKVVDKTLDVNVIGGLSYDLLVDNSVFTVNQGKKYSVGETMGLNQLAISSSLGMGMEYNFSKKITLNLEPTFRYFLNPFDKTYGSSVHPYSFGVFSGFSFRF
jgi:hypothetical protein